MFIMPAQWLLSCNKLFLNTELQARKQYWEHFKRVLGVTGMGFKPSIPPHPHNPKLIVDSNQFTPPSLVVLNEDIFVLFPVI